MPGLGLLPPPGAQPSYFYVLLLLLLYVVPCRPLNVSEAFVNCLYMDPVVTQALASIDTLPDELFPEINELVLHAKTVLQPYDSDSRKNVHVLWAQQYLELIRDFLATTTAIGKLAVAARQLD